MFNIGGPQHRPQVNHRIPELLESLKAEFESLAHDVNVYKIQRDDYERTLQAQLSEITNIQNSVYELERRQNSIHQKYEEELTRLHKDNLPDKNPPSNLRSLQSIISKEMTIQNNIHDNDKPTLPSLLSNKHTGMPMIEPMSPYKLGSIQFPHANSINNNNNLPQPLNLPIPQDQSKQIVQPISSPVILTGSKRKADSPDKSFFPNNINSSVVDSNILPSAKIVKKEVDDSPRPNLHHDLDKNRDLNFPKPSLNFSGNSPFSVNSSNNINLNNQDGRHTVDLDDKNDFKIRYSNPQKTIDIELTHEILHKSVVCCVRFSNDGKFLATGSNRKAQIFNAVDGTKYKSFRGGAKDGDLYLRSVCFSPDGKYLACGAEDKTIKLWDIEENKLSHTFVSHTMDIYSLDYSCDGNLIVSGSGDKKVKLWDVQKGKCLFTLGSDEIGPKDGVTSVAFSPDRRTIAAGSLDRIVRLWDVETGTLLERFEGHLDSVYSVSFSVDGKSLASGSLDKTLKLWDASEPRSRGKCRSTFIGHTDFVLSVAFSPDDKWLISGSKDRTVQFWDPRNVTSHCKLEGHKNSVISVAINPVLGKFSTGSGDNKAKIWNYKVVG